MYDSPGPGQSSDSPDVSPIPNVIVLSEDSWNSEETSVSDRSGYSEADPSSEDIDPYALYAFDEDMPAINELHISDIRSDNSNSDEDTEISSEDIDRSSSLGAPVFERDNARLEPMNFAFASWSWTHGVSVESFNSLQQLLHSNFLECPFDSLLYSLKGVRNHVLRFMRLSPMFTMSIRLKTSKLPTKRRNNRRIATQAAVIRAESAQSTLYYHQVRDLIIRVIANPSLLNNMFLHQFTSLHQPASAPWHGFTWRSSYTLSRSANPPTIRGKVLFPGCFVRFRQHRLLSDANIRRLKAFEIRSLWRQSDQMRVVRVCSVVRSEETGALECEVDPVIGYDELPFEFQTDDRQLQTDHGGEKRFMLDFSWDKLVVPVSYFIEILSGEDLLECHLILRHPHGRHPT